MAVTACFSGLGNDAMTQPFAIFFITTARSGTQWLASILNEVYPDLVRAEHEPVRYRYRPRETLRDIHRQRRLREDDSIRKHLEQIHRTLQKQAYVEVGFPAYAMAPLLREEFDARLRLVHLTRHPVLVAASLVTHGWYREGQRPDIHETVAPIPSDPGVALPHYSARWMAMSSFEKCLYYWYQVHLFGVDQEAESSRGAFARYQFEWLVKEPAAREAFRAFLGLPSRPSWYNLEPRHVDVYRRRTNQSIDWTAIAAHPEILDLARRLGYAPEDFDRRALAARYENDWLTRSAKLLVRAAALGKARAVPDRRAFFPAVFGSALTLLHLSRR